METLAQLSGEVVTIGVDPTRGRAAACTSALDAAVLDDGGLHRGGSALVRSALEGYKGSWSSDVGAAFVGGRLYLNVGAYELPGGGTTAILALDLNAGTVQEIARERAGFYRGRACPPVGVADRFVLVETFDGEAAGLAAFERPDHVRHEILRLEIEADGEDARVVRPLIAAAALSPSDRRLFLVTDDPDNLDGNRVLALALGADCRALVPPETLLRVVEEPYAPCIGGACVNPHTGEAACLMYASEWERFVPIARLPEEGDPIPVADLHLVRPGAAPRRLDVLGRLGTNAAFYDRESEAPNLPHVFRIGFDFGGARAEVTPLIALGPDRYLVGLFRGTLLAIRTDTGEHATVHHFDAPITALAAGLAAGKALVGLADGGVYALGVDVPRAS